MNSEGVGAGLSLARSRAYSVLQLRGLATLPYNTSTAVLAPLKLEGGTGGPVR
jgi:kynurenine formamidase